MLDVTDLVGQPFEKYPCWELVKEVFRRRGETFPKGEPDRIRSWGKAVAPGESCRKKADTPYPARTACPDSSSGRCRKGSFRFVGGRRMPTFFPW